MLKEEIVILLAEDDEAHASLIRRNLRRAGVGNEIFAFKDGKEILDFLFEQGDGPRRTHGVPYLLLLDIKMPRVDGVEVLRRVKQNKELRKMPIVMVTTTDDPREVEKCHELGCNNYITKPIEYDKFVKVIRQLGMFLLVVEVPIIDGEDG